MKPKIMPTLVWRLIFLATLPEAAIHLSGCSTEAASPSTLAVIDAIEHIRNDCRNRSANEVVSAAVVFAANGALVISSTPDVCPPNSEAQTEHEAFSLGELPREKANQGLVVIANANPSVEQGGDKMINDEGIAHVRDLSEAGYTILDIPDLHSGAEAEAKVRERYPNGYDGPVHVIFADHGDQNGKLGRNQVKTSELADGIAQGLGPNGDRCLLIGSCFAKRAINDMVADGTIDKYHSVIAASDENQIAWGNSPSDTRERATSRYTQFLVDKANGNIEPYDKNGNRVVESEEIVGATDIGITRREPKTYWQRGPQNKWVPHQARPRSDRQYEHTVLSRQRTAYDQGSAYVDSEQVHYPQVPQVGKSGVLGVLDTSEPQGEQQAPAQIRRDK